MVHVLVTGTGLVGRRVIQVLLANGCIVSAVTRKSELPWNDVHVVRADISVPGFTSLLEGWKQKVHFIVHTSAMSNVDRCETEKDAAMRTNALATEELACLAKRWNAHLIYISTDYVFDGSKGNYGEDDETGPVQHYGVTKLAGETLARGTGCKLTIARTSVVYDDNPERPNFGSWLVRELDGGRRVRVAEDQTASPTYAPDLARFILRAIERPGEGVYHAAGSTRASRLDLAYRVCELWGFDHDLIEPVKTSELGLAARRPPDSSLDVSRARKEFEYRFLTLEEGLVSMRRGKL